MYLSPEIIESAKDFNGVDKSGFYLDKEVIAP